MIAFNEEGRSPLLLKATILVIEDEVELLDVIAQILRGEGYDIIKVRTPPDALGIFETMHPVIDAVLSDFNLPGINGLELAEELRRLQPHIPIIFISGNYDACDRVTERGYMCCRKPFSFADLAATVGDLIGQSRGSNLTIDAP